MSAGAPSLALMPHQNARLMGFSRKDLSRPLPGALLTFVPAKDTLEYYDQDVAIAFHSLPELPSSNSLSQSTFFEQKETV